MACLPRVRKSPSLPHDQLRVSGLPEENSVKAVLALVLTFICSSALAGGDSREPQRGQPCGTTIDGNRDNECPSRGGSGRNPRRSRPIPEAIQCYSSVAVHGTFEREDDRSTYVISFSGSAAKANVESARYGNRTCLYAVENLEATLNGAPVQIQYDDLFSYGDFGDNDHATLKLVINGRPARVDIGNLRANRGSLQGGLDFDDEMSAVYRKQSETKDFLRHSADLVTLPTDQTGN